MIERRNPHRLADLANCPGQLSAALDVGRAHDAGDFFDGGVFWIGASVRPTTVIAVSPRIEINKAVDQPFRFYEVGSPFVSSPKKDAIAPQ
jgi:DNA-3-methyladenine glycosylase